MNKNNNQNKVNPLAGLNKQPTDWSKVNNEKTKAITKPTIKPKSVKKIVFSQCASPYTKTFFLEEDKKVRMEFQLFSKEDYLQGDLLEFYLAFAKKFELYKLFEKPDEEGKINLDKETLIKHLQNLK